MITDDKLLDMCYEYMGFAKAVQEEMGRVRPFFVFVGCSAKHEEVARLANELLRSAVVKKGAAGVVAVLPSEDAVRSVAARWELDAAVQMLVRELAPQGVVHVKETLALPDRSCAVLCTLERKGVRRSWMLPVIPQGDGTTLGAPQELDAERLIIDARNPLPLFSVGEA
jgi:hypothetical protein